MAGAKQRVVTVRMVLVSAVVGVVLAVASVPVSAVAGRMHQTWQPGFPDADWQGDIDRGDHVELISWYDWAGQSMWSTHWIPKPLDPAWQGSLSGWIVAADDPRPAFARRPYPGHVQGVYVQSFGWPLRGGAGRTVMENPASGPRTIHDEHLVEVPFRSTFVRFPLRPIWPGLLGNTLFYAALTLALLVALRAWRTRRRRARGRCVACGYELGEGVGVCPECGLAERPLAEGA